MSSPVILSIFFQTRPQEVVVGCRPQALSCTPTTRHLRRPPLMSTTLLPRHLPLCPQRQSRTKLLAALEGGRVRALPVNLATTSCRKSTQPPSTQSSLKNIILSLSYCSSEGSHAPDLTTILLTLVPLHSQRNRSNIATSSSSGVISPTQVAMSGQSACTHTFRSSAIGPCLPRLPTVRLLSLAPWG
jgi:hypothetical protein